MSLSCPYCSATNTSSGSREMILSGGSFRRKSDNSLQQRFRCRPCKRTFSSATLELCYRQRKRSLNPLIFQSLVSGVSLRRLAILLKVDRKTIVKKFLFLGLIAHHRHLEDLKRYPVVTEMEFDDLETFEHSKLKPLSVVMAVESHSRRILGFRVAQMPAKGLLVQRSLKKYGKRADHRKYARESLFEELRSLVHPQALIKSDESPHYPGTVKKFFSQAEHKVFKGRRGCIVGQGELKAGGFDHIFSLNHSFAMMRANINRLFRRTWNTTKLSERLSLHIALYVLFHNLCLIQNKGRNVVPA